MVELVVFVITAVGAIAGAVAVITARNPVHSAMGLLGTLFSLAVIYVVNLAHLVAAVQVIVYAGAVMTLFLFVIMLIGVDKAEDTSEHLPRQRMVVSVLGVALLLVVAAIVVSGRFTWVPAAGSGVEIPNGTVQEIAGPLFTDWVLAFEVTALLLTVAAAGAIALAYFKRALIREEHE